MRDRRDGDYEEGYDRGAPIRTPRLLMRKPGADDRALIVRLAANPGIARGLAAELWAKVGDGLKG